MHINAEIYRLKLFKLRGYTRKQCPHCKSWFWTKSRREHCNEAPCTDYTFFDLDFKFKGISYLEVKNKFLDFFERNEHTIIPPKPVVARWRDDLYLTIASIVVFQPFVTSGVIPPPANPLVIAQPCIRLEDLDNVGITFGRHFTNFIMGGHHAFNYPDKYVYWTEETVDFARRFFVEELGIPEDELSFKESWWEGGGNAGPCFEVSIGGLEVATLVFMMYEVRNGSYKEIPLKIVDTGYGIERIAWLVSKAPTAFHVVYGELVHRFHKKLGIPEPIDTILYTATKFAGRIAPENPASLETHFKRTASELGISLREVYENLQPLVTVYALLDHTKTIALLLSDGVVPSNSGEGYLARLVIRRALRQLHRLQYPVALADLVEEQLRYWSHEFPNMNRMKSVILEILNIEEEKWKELIAKAPLIVKKYGKKMSLDTLIEIYDSKGIPPEILADEASKHGVRINIPYNFYALVASRHEKPSLKRVEKEKIPREIISRIRRFPETRRLFHEDPYIKEFDAKLLGCFNNYVVLDSTAFYPEGGGQRGDEGELVIDGITYKVLDTQKINNVIIHILDKPCSSKPGARVHGKVDWNKRYRAMKHHTVTHVLLGALRRVLGPHIWQAGAEKSEYKGRLDVTHYKVPSRGVIKEIENVVNKLILERRPVKTYMVPRYEAESKYGFILYQGGVPPDPVIRIVEIKDWDVQACFGTHLNNTAEIGSFKIINVEKIQDGVIRFEYVAGPNVAEYADYLETKLLNIGSSVGSAIDDADRKVKSLVNELGRLKSILSRYRSEWLTKFRKEIEENIEDLEVLQYVILFKSVPESHVLRELFKELTDKRPRLIIIWIEQTTRGSRVEISMGREMSRIIRADELFNKILETLQGRGGGKDTYASGIVNAPAKTLAEIVVKILKSYAGRSK
ncbi:MAG: alanine--tRNA ligase [Thermoprotei archaeon]|mgnify:CR=1 FL=1|nr:MAG: alanine--tRNA ligase [Thermoprotei archaeon]